MGVPTSFRPARVARGLGWGIAAGGGWAAGEWTIAWAAGSVAPRPVWLAVLALDVGLGALVGAVAAIVWRGGFNGAVVGLAVALSMGFLRILAPPGIGGEILYAGCAAAAWMAGARVLAVGEGTWLAAVWIALLGVVALVGGEFILDGRHVALPRGAGLIAAVVAAPLLAVSIDRVVSLVVPSQRRRFALGLALAGAAAIGWAQPLDVTPMVDDVVTGVPPKGGAPDVILVSLDTTRADHLSTYGYARETSPNLSRLAADGLLYREARSPAAWTLPAHASMMTGLFPRAHGAHLAGGFVGGESIDGRRNVAHPLAPSKTTLAEILRDHGYRTAAFVANFSYLYRDYGLGQGFGVYDDAPGILLPVEPPVLRASRLVRPSFAAKPFRTARDINAAGLAWLDAQDRARPAFLFLNYMEPHQPWIADPPFDRWAREVPDAWALARRNLYTHAVHDVPAETATFIRANYDGQIAAMDEALGELIDALVARDRYDEALIIVTADHGELLGEHSEMGHMGRTLYEPLLRIPLVVKHPGTERPRGAVAHPVQLVDLLPTIAEASGAPVPDGLDGVGLDVGSRVVYAEEGINPFLVADYGDFYDRAMRVVYDGAYKLLVTSRGEEMLFDLGDDPGEDRNLAPAEPERVVQLQSLLDRQDRRAVATAATPVSRSTIMRENRNGA